MQKPNVVSGIAYQATKHGVRGLAHGTMMEEREHGIRVSVVFPGPCETPLMESGRSRRAGSVRQDATTGRRGGGGALHRLAASRAYVPEIVLGASLM